MDPGKVLRAARLSRVPGVSISEACERFGVRPSDVQRVRKTVRDLSLEELVVAGLTANGTKTSGAITPEVLESLASWIDMVDKGGCNAAEILALLDRAKAWIEIEKDTWRLVQTWP